MNRNISGSCIDAWISPKTRFSSSLARANDLSLLWQAGCYRYIRRTKTRMYGNSAKFCARVCLSECAWEARERRDGNKSTRASCTLPGVRAEEEEDAQTARLGARPGRTEPISLSIPLHHAQRDGHLCKLDRAIASDIMPGHRFSGSGVRIRPRQNYTAMISHQWLASMKRTF